MKILLTNDDGIEAPGIRALHRALAGLGDITTIAPYTVQSATSHGVTFNEPMMIHSTTMDDGSIGHAVDGRPPPPDTLFCAVLLELVRRFA